jgi:glycosyltransferase involved in cell wall biosynthesis
MLPALNRRRPALDAIIVPASRPAQNLDHAVALALALNCWLVVFCSRQARAEEVNALAAAKRLSRVLAIDLPLSYTHKLLNFASSGITRGELPAVCENPNGDLSTKRNLGLLFARMMSWERIFFMDDDIRNVTPDDLRATTAMLGRYRSAGMRVTDFPDNSVVCHAHRQTGAPQDVFVSGSVLAVSSIKPFNFFPEVYNEDWLFFYDDACSKQLGWSGRNATQLCYDPFGQPQRAERQEFGDVLAEGLYALLDLGLGVEAAATRAYWNQFLIARRDLLEEILERSNDLTPDIQAKLTSAVQTAMLCLMQIKPVMYEKYVEAWRKDRIVWAENVDRLPRSPSVESALGELDLKLSGSARVEDSPPAIMAASGTPASVA